ncbi:MAG: hypothetical protein ACI9HX_000434 [Pseudoalteromonas tetraodonis]|jgi:hypothetical protein
METPIHSIVSLFDQLGLKSSDEGIRNFAATNAPLAAGVDLHKAPFWNASQASFLQQALEEDADWVEIVNQLDAMLR